MAILQCKILANLKVKLYQLLGVSYRNRFAFSMQTTINAFIKRVNAIILREKYAELFRIAKRIEGLTLVV